MKKLRAFDIFTAALRDFETKDKDLYSWPRNRVALTHSLAQRLWSNLQKEESQLCVDMSPYIEKSKRSINPDIAVHNRKGQIALAVVCRNDYLSEAEQKGLMKLAGSCTLAMAVSFFPQKSYMLLYRAVPDAIEYFHFDRNTLTVEAVRSKVFENKSDSSDQAYLSL